MHSPQPYPAQKIIKKLVFAYFLGILTSSITYINCFHPCFSVWHKTWVYILCLGMACAISM